MVSRRYLVKRRGAYLFAGIIMLCAIPGLSFAQVDSSGAAETLTLQQCVDYALKHQPIINQGKINTSIAKTTNAINLSGWLPQVNLSANVLHYNTLPTSFISDSAGGPPLQTHTGIVNSGIPELSVTQTIFNPQLLYAAQAAPLYVKQAEQITDTAKIYIVSVVCKSFYALLLSLEQINVLKEDTARLDRNVQDTYHQFVGGIVDETDYEEAIITLNNSLVQLKQQIENVTPEYAVLKQYMGYPPEKQFNVAFDTLQMMQEIYFDTAQQLQYDNRAEYQLIRTVRDIQHQQTVYYGLAFLPTVSVFYNNYYEFESNSASDLFKNAYPYSYFGLSLNIPLFTGFSRLGNMHKSRLQEDIVTWSEASLKSQIYTQYTTAMANYKGNLYNWKLMKENVTRAKNVYRIVSLQYKEGIVAYLNMIVAESNLIASEIGYTNALFQLLSSKIDVEKAMGVIPIK